MNEWDALWLVTIAAFVWILSRSPIVQWVTVLSLLLGWGGLTVGATLFIIFAIHLPKENYGAAVATLLAGGFLSLWFFAYGLPCLIDHVRRFKESVALWD